MDQINDAIPTNEAEADALLAEIEAPTQENAGAEAPGAQSQAPAAQSAPTPTAEEYKFTVGGKEVKGTRDQMIQWAQMGYGAPNQIRELNAKIQKAQERETALSEIEKKYGEVDKYARENPDWLNFIQSEYQKRQSTQAPPNPVIESLKAEVSDLSKFKEEWAQERTREQHAKEDQALVEEFESLKKQYPKIDFSTPDQTGKSLEYRVLEYAVENKIAKFTTAFRDYYHDELMKQGTAEAKEKMVQDKVQKQKLGIVSQGPTPSQRKSSDSVKGKSYNDIQAEILEEYGITG